VRAAAGVRAGRRLGPVLGTFGTGREVEEKRNTVKERALGMEMCPFAPI
jgi:hypothetical protein